MSRVFLKQWDIEKENKVKLTYKDDTILYVSKTDFDRAFGAIVSASKEEVLRDFAL